VLDSIRESVPTQWRAKAEELRLLAAEDPALTLAGFLDRSGLELDDVYPRKRSDPGKRSWSDLRAAAGLTVQPDGPHEAVLRRACGRLLHVDDAERLDHWSAWLACDGPPQVSALDVYEQRRLRMLVAQVLDQVQVKGMTLQDGADLLWQHPQVRAELLELLQVLKGSISHLPTALDVAPDVPLHVHARYTRIEILAAWGVGDGVHTMSWQSGVHYVKPRKADLFAFTLDKTTGQFSPTTRYRDFAISQELIHWESQSVTRADSETGLRYQQHEARGSLIMLFARLNTTERAFHFLGPATYVGHTGEMPMAVTWRLQHRLPGDLYQAYAAAVA
jgi:hypothetical protein